MKPSLPLAFTLCTFGALLTSAQGDPYTPEYTQGNVFHYSSSSHQKATTNDGVYVRFTATENTSATSLSLYLNQGSTATSLTYGLQADDGNGKPSGTFLASGTATVGSTAAWSTITFAEQALVAGQAYHVVVQPVDAGLVNIRRLSTNTAAPQTFGILDNQYSWGVMTGGTVPQDPNANGHHPISFVVGTTSAHSMGYALSNSQFSSFLSSVAPAQRFQFTTEEPGHHTLDSITLRLNTGTENLKSVQVTLLDDANTTLATTVLDSSVLKPGISDYYTLSFEDNPVLVEGAYYKLALSTAEAGTSSVRWFGYVSQSTDSAINSGTYQGLEGYAFTYTDTTFSSLSSTELNKDYNFSYTTAIPEPGTAALALVGLALAVGMWRRNRG